MAENTSPKKVITLDSMKVLVDKIKEDFATKEAVTQQIKEAGGVGLSCRTFPLSLTRSRPGTPRRRT